MEWFLYEWGLRHERVNLCHYNSKQTFTTIQNPNRSALRVPKPTGQIVILHALKYCIIRMRHITALMKWPENKQMTAGNLIYQNIKYTIVVYSNMTWDLLERMQQNI